MANITGNCSPPTARTDFRMSAPDRRAPCQSSTSMSTLERTIAFERLTPS